MGDDVGANEPSPHDAISELERAEDLGLFTFPSFAFLSYFFCFLSSDFEAEANVKCLFTSRLQGCFGCNVSAIGTGSWDGTKDNIGEVRATIISAS